MRLAPYAFATLLSLPSTQVYGEGDYSYPQDVAQALNDTVGRCGYILNYGALSESGRLYINSDEIEHVIIDLDILKSWVEEIKFYEQEESDYGFTPTLNPKECIISLQSFSLSLEDGSDLKKNLDEILSIISKPFGGIESVLIGKINHLKNKMR